MKKSADTSGAAWLEQFTSGTTAESKAPAFKPTQTPSERKAAETTRVVREMVEAEQKTNAALTTKLRAARLAKEAEDRAAAAQLPPKAKAPRKTKAKPAGGAF